MQITAEMLGILRSVVVESHRTCVFEWPAVVKMLMDRLHINTGLTFNSVLANLYRDGHDHVSWHADDEPALGHQPTIATLSFGDTRTFHLRKNPPPVRLLCLQHFILPSVMSVSIRSVASLVASAPCGSGTVSKCVNVLALSVLQRL